MRGRACLPLYQKLCERFGVKYVETEYQFDWLFLPKSNERTILENKILEKLWEDCKERSYIKFRGQKCNWKDIYFNDNEIHGVSKKIEVDFYLPKLKIIIEFDEKQHFTYERWLTLNLYPNEDFCYDISTWRDLCFRYQLKDKDPLTRDWKRAFRDTIRDLRARENNIPLIRVLFNNYNAINIEQNINKLFEIIELYRYK